MVELSLDSELLEKVLEKEGDIDNFNLVKRFELDNKEMEKLVIALNKATEGMNVGQVISYVLLDESIDPLKKIILIYYVGVSIEVVPVVDESETWRSYQ